MTTCQLFTPIATQRTLWRPVRIKWHIGDVIAKLRQSRRMNQTALAESVGVSKATIVRLEDGDPKVARETYLAAAKALGTTMAELETEAARLTFTDEETQQPAAPRVAGRSFHRADGSAKPERQRDVGPPTGHRERRSG